MARGGKTASEQFPGSFGRQRLLLDLMLHAGAYDDGLPLLFHPPLLLQYLEGQSAQTDKVITECAIAVTLRGHLVPSLEQGLSEPA